MHFECDRLPGTIRTGPNYLEHRRIPTLEWLVNNSFNISFWALVRDPVALGKMAVLPGTELVLRAESKIQAIKPPEVG